MISDIVSVTDHIKNFSIEKKLLGNYFNEKVSEKTTIILVWHEKIDSNFLSKYPSIRAIVRYGVGYDNIDIDYCKNCDFLYQSEEVLAWTNDKTAKINNMLGTGDDFILTDYNKDRMEK